jgi:hypothetical protein
MNWKKIDQLFKPGKSNWMVTHGQAPFIEIIGDHSCKIHFSGRDLQGRSRGGWVTLDLRNFSIIDQATRPTLDIGDIGCFDDCGAMPSCIVDQGDLKYMYYTGWSQAVTTPFTFFIGLAISRDGGKVYERYSKAPVLGRNKIDPFLTCSPWVIREDGIWKMWYVSGTGWEYPKGDSKLKHYYRICYAQSDDGLTWNSTGNVCIDFNEDEYAIARPIVYKEDGLYKMWYCYRGGWDTYRAGYAESKDGLAWTRLDDTVNLDVSAEGWDSDMICYPYVFKYEGMDYMLYNGNAYGKTGFGIAKRLS